MQKQREKLESLTVRDLLTDTDYREYAEKFGKVFKAGIGYDTRKMFEAMKGVIGLY